MGKRGSHAHTFATSILLALHENALVEVLRAAKAAGVLVWLSSSSKQLCSLARSRVPACLQVSDRAQASLLLQLQRRGRPPFSGCTELCIIAADAASCCMALGILSAPQQWPAVHQLVLTVKPDPDHQQQQQQPGRSEHLRLYSFGMLCLLPALRTLRRLELDLPHFDACNASLVAQLVPLTGLHLSITTQQDDVRHNLLALSAMTNLVQLRLVDAPCVQPAGSAAGPFCLPGSLTKVALIGTRRRPCFLATWFTHLPGAPQLQQLKVQYEERQHHSAHPRALVPLLAQHHRKLRVLTLQCTWGPEDMDWDVPVEGLANAADPVDWPWYPDADLAALTGLRCLTGGFILSIRTEEHWQHLAQLRALTRLARVDWRWVPQQQPAATSLRLLDLQDCEAYLGGYDLGLLLLACPQLQQAHASINGHGAAEEGDTRPRLGPHPTLEDLHLNWCNAWGNDDDAAAAAAEFAALAPVIRSVPDITLMGWPRFGDVQPWCGLPNLGPCTGLTALVFGVHHEGGVESDAGQEDFLLMLAPLVQLQYLKVYAARCLNARVVGWLQHMLPQLEHVKLSVCGRLLPWAAAGNAQQQGQQQQQQQQEQEEERVLQQVKQLLCPGLQLEVQGYCR